MTDSLAIIEETTNPTEQWRNSEKNLLIALLNRGRLVQTNQLAFEREYEEMVKNHSGKKVKKLPSPDNKFNAWLRQKNISKKQLKDLLRRLEIVEIFKEAGLEDEMLIGNLQLSHFDLLLDEAIPEAFLHVCVQFLNNRDFDKFHPSTLIPLIDGAKVQLDPDKNQKIQDAVNSGLISSSNGALLLKLFNEITNQFELKAIAETEIAKFLEDIATKGRLNNLIKILKALQKIDTTLSFTQDLHEIFDFDEIIEQAHRNDALVQLGDVLGNLDELLKLLEKFIKKRAKLQQQLDKLYVQSSVSSPLLREFEQNLAQKMFKSPIVIHEDTINLPVATAEIQVVLNEENKEKE